MLTTCLTRSGGHLCLAAGIPDSNGTRQPRGKRGSFLDRRRRIKSASCFEWERSTFRPSESSREMASAAQGRTFPFRNKGGSVWKRPPLRCYLLARAIRASWPGSVPPDMHLSVQRSDLGRASPFRDEGGKVWNREGFRMPAGRRPVQPCRGPASESLRRKNPRGLVSGWPSMGI